MQRFDYTLKSVRSSAILTNSYVAGTVVSRIQDQNQLIVLVQLTLGSLTTAEIKVEYSNDGSTYFRDVSYSTSAGTAQVSPLEYQFSADGNYALAIPNKYPYVKISAKGTGTVTSSAMAVDLIVGRS